MNNQAKYEQSGLSIKGIAWRVPLQVDFGSITELNRSQSV